MGDTEPPDPNLWGILENLFDETDCNIEKGGGQQLPILSRTLLKGYEIWGGGSNFGTFSNYMELKNLRIRHSIANKYAVLETAMIDTLSILCASIMGRVISNSRVLRIQSRI